jgi:hypothetical protein
MKLYRSTSFDRQNWHGSAEQRNFRRMSSRKVEIEFQDFGEGFFRQPDFTVSITWTDVSALIRHFAKMKHPKAVELQKLRSRQKEAAASEN